ncbi:MAG: hypothetical protein AAFQ27_11610 [Pseudomonadota bacterium]
MMIAKRIAVAVLMVTGLHGVLLAESNQATEQTASPLRFEYSELTLVRSSRDDTPSTITVEKDEIPAQPTRILDEAAAERLFRNSGVTLQWIGWEERGPTWVSVTEDGHWMLLGGQGEPAGANLDIEGFVTEIGSDYFIFSGTIKMFDTPDEGRFCKATKEWRFAVTQNRKYWRLREFGWCDYLTDYIDIYF